MKVDIIPAAGSNADFEVWRREGAPKAYDDGYEGKPLFGPASDVECMEWCCENGHAYRHRKRVALVVPGFFKDIEKKCDLVYESMVHHAKQNGWTFSSDVTYRASAAWKDSPTHYAYRGDLGGCAGFDGVTEETWHTDHGQAAKSDLDWLRGVASGLWELGFTLTFDRYGKHTVFNTCEQWVTLDEAE